MRAIITLGALALLAGCGNADPAATGERGPATTAAADTAASGPPMTPERRSFRDWLASCDNGGDCAAFAGPADGTGAGWLRVALSAGGEARPTIMAGFWPRTEAAGPLTLTIDSRSWPLDPGPAPDHEDAALGQVSPEAVAQVIAALSSGRSLTLARGGETLALSPAGASAALLWIDEKQGRLDTPTALIRRGERDASGVPAAPVLPVLTPAPATAPASATLQTALSPALAGHAEVRRCRENLRWNAGLFEERSRDRLDATTELWGVPCDAGAYNLMTRYFLTGPDGTDPRPLDFRGGGEGGGEPQAVLVNAQYDPATRTLTQFAKARGLGDCGVHQRWVWTGQGFALSHEAIMGECWGVPADLWPTTWRTRQP